MRQINNLLHLYYIADVTHPFFKINELQFSEFATAIDSSERLRNISYIVGNLS